ncbi:MAG: Stage sporulation protein, partial [Actinomycetota bacterium]
FLSSNPGLRSRFDTVVHFPDFNDAELLAIFEKLVAENEYTLRGAAVSAAHGSRYVVWQWSRDAAPVSPSARCSRDAVEQI